MPPTPDADPAPLARLNPAQRQVIDHGDAPLLVVAGAGSGKTGTLAMRAARLIQRGADPQRLLLLTFSRRAAEEMSRRAAAALPALLGRPSGAAPPALPWAGTFHAIGARLLRRWAEPLGLDPQFTVVDRSDAEDLIAMARETLGLARQRQRFPLKGTCLAIYSRVVNTEDPLAQVLDQHFPWCAHWRSELQALFATYDGAKRRQRVFDLDDLLGVWAEALADEAVARAMGARFDHVLVDEYQDTNRLQARILQRLRPGGTGLTVVGDDAQAIYRFRGAEWRNLLDFPGQNGPKTRVIALEQNYRATPALLAASNALMAQAAERHAKTMWSAMPDGARPAIVSVRDEAAQAAWVADEVLRQREAGLALRRQAVLFRAAQHSIALELELVRRDIPFVKYGGLQFMQAAHVKDLLALLRWARNPRHTLAGYRCMVQLPGIGPARARQLSETLAASDDPAAALRAFTPPPAAGADWSALRDTWLALHALRPPAADGWPQAVDIAMAWLLPQLPRLYADAPAREIDLRQLQRLARGWPSQDRFLAELTLDPPQASGREAGPPHRDDDWLVLSTIHSAKGQEWSAVTVLSVVDGCLPADMATGSAEEIDEERRLLYVAMTRAQRHLHLVVPQRFHVTRQPVRGDDHVHALPSRFLTPDLAALCERITPSADGVDDDADGPTPAVPLLDRLAARWD